MDGPMEPAAPEETPEVFPPPSDRPRLRPLRVALCLLVATALWLPCLHFFFTPRREDLHQATGPLSPRAQALLARQLVLWEDPGPRAAEHRRMRRTNAEWDFMGRTFLVLALANATLRDPTTTARHVGVMDKIIDDTLALEREHGMLYFMMPYATRKPFVLDPPRSAFVDGEIALMLGARALVARSALYEAELESRLSVLRERMDKSPVLSMESYPDECWTFCNTLSIAAMRLSDALRGERRGLDLAKRWLDVAKEKLVDRRTGLLVSSFTVDGQPMDGPEGSSIWIAAHALLLVDPEFAKDQYVRARRHLGADFLGFGWAREWPRSWVGPVDVDSGPIVPIVGASAGSSGFALLGASAFGDETYLGELAASLDFAGFPMRDGASLRYAASNQVGDAALLYALAFGPLWSRVLEGGAP
jgi:hypothetical protein